MMTNSCWKIYQFKLNSRLFYSLYHSLGIRARNNYSDILIYFRLFLEKKIKECSMNFDLWNNLKLRLECRIFQVNTNVWTWWYRKASQQFFFLLSKFKFKTLKAILARLVWRFYLQSTAVQRYKDTTKFPLIEPS